jgi:hypothetical protein
MPQKKLDLLKLAARIVTQSRAGSSKIMRRQSWDMLARGRLLANVPDRLFRDAVPPELTSPTDTSKERATIDTGCR